MDRMVSNTTGFGNSAFGLHALVTHVGSYNCALGDRALATFMPGNSPTCTNWYELAKPEHLASPNCLNYNNTTSLGYEATVIASNQVRIGNSNVTRVLEDR